MAELILWKDKEIRKLRRDIDRLFSRIWNGFGVSPTNDIADDISFEASESGDTYVLKAHLPGVNPDDIDISVSGYLLTITGEKTEQKITETGSESRLEKRRSKFSRSLRLTSRVKVDEAEATYQNEILTIVLPKLESEDRGWVKIKTDNN